MSRRLAISSLLCDDEALPEAASPAPATRHSTARSPRRSPSPSFTPSSRPSSDYLSHQSGYGQRPSSYPTSRSPPIATHAFNGLDALVHAATEERRRLTEGSPGPSPSDSSIHGYSRQLQQPPLQGPRSHQSPPAQHYSHSQLPFQGHSPIPSPTRHFQSPPVSVRNPAFHTQQYVHAEQRFPGWPLPLPERTLSVPSSALDSSHLSYSRENTQAEAYITQRQQAENEQYERQRHLYQERTYQDEPSQVARKADPHRPESPTVASNPPHRSQVPAEITSYSRPSSSRGSLNDSASNRHDRLAERDRSSIHDLCLPSNPGPSPRLERPGSPRQAINNKRRHSDTHGPSPYPHQLSSTSRDDAAHEIRPPTPTRVSAPVLELASHHTERRYLGLADMMSPIEERRPSVSKEHPRSEHASVLALSMPPRKRTPPGSSEGRAKALKSMGEFTRTPFVVPTIPPSLPQSKGLEDRQHIIIANDRPHIQHEHDEGILRSRERPGESDPGPSPDNTIAGRQRSQPRTSSGTSIPPHGLQLSTTEVLNASVPERSSSAKTQSESTSGPPSQRSRSKHARTPIVERAPSRKLDTPPILKPTSSESSSHPRHLSALPKAHKLPPTGSNARTPPPPQRKGNDEADEWFLEQFEDAPVGHPPSPSSRPHDATSGKKPFSKKRSSSREQLSRRPIDDALPIDQELEALVADSPILSKVEARDDLDMDVDLAVDQLVAETLNDVDDKTEETPMEVDVDNELLSLVEESSGEKTQDSTRPARSSAGEVAPITSIIVQPTPTIAVEKDSLDRSSMPPPTSLPQAKEAKVLKDTEEKLTNRETTQTPPLPAKKKKESVKKPKATSATVTSATAAVRPRAKATNKAKPKTSENTLSVPSSNSKSKAPAAAKKIKAARSRSASVKPGGEQVEIKPPEVEVPEEEPEEDKLYCVCKTKYDEEKIMIACDKCDEWYHTRCVQMPDLEVDLVDQFICPPCIEKHSDMNLRTTYKPRCLFGLIQDDPDSPDACHKPARGSFSKYCSKECGVSYMQLRLTAWTRKGGKKDKLWDSVKSAQPREGIVVRAPDVVTARDKNAADGAEKSTIASKMTPDLAGLNEHLESVVNLREEIKRGLDVVKWREKLMTMAADRAAEIGECGWDQRLCFGDAEWADFGAGVLETYYEADKEEGQPEGFGAWWCTGQAACERHSGWQNLRYREISLETEQKEDALHNVTTREREIRKRMEDLLAPQDQKPSSPLSHSKNASSKTNGTTKTQANGVVKRAKKRKAPS